MRLLCRESSYSSCVCLRVYNERANNHAKHTSSMFTKLSSVVVSHFRTKYEYILYWKLSFSDTKFFKKDPRKTQDERLTKVPEPVGDKDSVSLENVSTILNEIFAYYSKTFAMKKHSFSFWPWESSHDFKRQIRAFYSDKSSSRRHFFCCIVKCQ